MRRTDQLIRPGLEVYVPVLNIGAEQVGGLRDKLSDRRGQVVSPKDVRRILRPAVTPRADLVLAEEVASLHEYLGINYVEPERLEDLRSFVNSVLASHFDCQPVGSVDTLPAYLDEEDAGLALSVAGSKRVAAGRGAAQAAFGAYYGVRKRKIPPEVWVDVDDEMFTRVRLAESAGPSSNAQVRHLYVEVNSDDRLLPAQTEMGTAKAVPVQTAG